MIKLSGGRWKGQSLKTPNHMKTRPTSAKVREAIFSSLFGRIDEAHVLDLFAGSGALGLEALSRGASSLVSVESNPGTAKLLQANIRSLKAEELAEVLNGRVEKLWSRLDEKGPFDLCFADPPYQSEWFEGLAKYPWNSLLSEAGILVIEWGGPKGKTAIEELPERLAHLEKVREKSYGETTITTYGSARS